jgi:hypothetical protein
MSSTAKVDMITCQKALPSLRAKFLANSELGEVGLLSLADAEYQQARAMASVMGRKSRPNYMTLCNSNSYSASTIMYVNSEAQHFSTTWYKTLVLGKGTFSRWCDKGELYDPMDTAKIIGTEQHLVRVLKGNKSYETHNLVLSTSPFMSIDRNTLEWDLQKAYKMISRMHLLVESREVLYRGHLTREDRFDEIGLNASWKGRHFARREISLNILSFFINRQQMSVVQTAQRYLHQSLGSLDCDYSATLEKLEG